jgi:hypothetical protein
MILLSILAGVTFFLVLVLVAVHLMGKSNKPDEPAPSQMIHASGIYSIVRRSPRDSLGEFKPAIEKLTQYLASKNEDINKQPLNEADRQALVEHWKERLETNIREVEAGDHQGVEFYYYDFSSDDPVCKGTVNQGHFLTREEIFRCPQTIPPFHIGCRCMLKAHHGSENLRETTRLGMRPFFTSVNIPPLPSWTDVLKLS